jgi:SAM-dependent methyltransferase
MKTALLLNLSFLWTAPLTLAFLSSSGRSKNSRSSLPIATEATAAANDLAVQKRKLLGFLKPEPVADRILADPLTKEALVVTPTRGTILGGSLQPSKVKYDLKASPANATLYQGDSLTYLNLLEPAKSLVKGDGSNRETMVRNLAPLVPPPLRMALSTFAGADDYVPMRDLFTSPAVSYAYERGWRQGFAGAGFPGADEEATLAMEYFAPVMAQSDERTLVDMSCATGLFTRRFASSGKYKRVLGCDYSNSMLVEARRRINADAELSGRRRSTASPTQLDLVRLDVGQIPMQTDSIDALHAGAAMHCWPDLPAAVSEIHRVLKPGGRYFATTFLSTWFANLQGLGGSNEPSQQAFQYFESVNVLRKLLVEEGGFAPEKVFIEVLGDACAVIRAEK